MGAQRAGAVLSVMVGALVYFSPVAPAAARSTSCNQPQDPPIGASIETKPPGPNYGRGVTIDGKEVRDRGSALLQVVILDRTTRCVRDAFNFDLRPGVEHGTADREALLDRIRRAGTTNLVIIQGSGGRKAQCDPLRNYYVFDTYNVPEVWRPLFRQLGGRWDALPRFAQCDGNWSLIGRYGGAWGTAWESTIPVKGYLQRNVRGRYMFAPATYIGFDTNATDAGKDARSNAMTIGGTRYASRTLPAGDSGFQVVALDQYTLRPLQTPGLTNNTYRTNHVGIPVDAGVTAMTAALSRVRELSRGTEGSVVFVQSIGGPQPRDGHWIQLEAVLKTLGNHPDPFNTLDGSKAYAFVGGTNLVDGPTNTELSRRFSTTPEVTGARISGVLSRNHLGQLVSDVWSPVPGLNAMLEAAYQPAKRWPLSDTPQYREASEYFATAIGRRNLKTILKLRPPGTPVGWDFGDIRRDYYLAPDIIARPATRAMIASKGDLEYIPCPNTDDLPEHICEQFRKQLVTEIDEVELVYARFNNISAELTAAFVTAHFNLVARVDRVKQLVKPPEQHETGINWIAVVSSSLHVAASIADIVHAGVAFTLPAAGLEIAEQIAGEHNGVDPLPDRLNAKAGEIAERLAGRFIAVKDGLTTLEDLALSDPHKLDVATTLISAGRWEPRKFNALIDASLRKEIWGGLLSDVFQSWEVPLENSISPASTAAEFTCMGRDFGFRHPFRNALPGGQFAATVGFNGFRRIQHPKVLAREGSPEFRVLSAPDVQELFTTNSTSNGQSGLGLQQSEFFDQYFEQRVPRPGACY